MARKRWQFKTGPHGSRVTVEERKFGGAVRLKSYSPTRGAYVSRSLKFCVRDTDGKLIDDAVDLAKAAAADLVNGRLKQEAMPEKPTTFGQLVQRFREDRVSAMSERHAAGVERDLHLLERVIGKATIVATIDETTWNRLARLRSSGEIDARGVRVPPKQRKPVRARTVQVTLKTLGMLTRWGARVKRRGSTRPLLELRSLFSNDTANGTESPARDADGRRVRGDAGDREGKEGGATGGSRKTYAAGEGSGAP